MVIFDKDQESIYSHKVLLSSMSNNWRLSDNSRSGFAGRAKNSVVGEVKKAVNSAEQRRGHPPSRGCVGRRLTRHSEIEQREEMYS